MTVICVCHVPCGTFKINKCLTKNNWVSCKTVYYLAWSKKKKFAAQFKLKYTYKQRIWFTQFFVRTKSSVNQGLGVQARDFLNIFFNFATMFKAGGRKAKCAHLRILSPWLINIKQKLALLVHAWLWFGTSYNIVDNTNTWYIQGALLNTLL